MGMGRRKRSADLEKPQLRKPREVATAVLSYKPLRANYVQNKSHWQFASCDVDNFCCSFGLWSYNDLPKKNHGNIGFRSWSEAWERDERLMHFQGKHSSETNSIAYWEVLWGEKERLNNKAIFSAKNTTSMQIPISFIQIKFIQVSNSDMYRFER